MLFQLLKRTVQITIHPIQTKPSCQMRFPQVWLQLESFMNLSICQLLPGLCPVPRKR